MDPLLILPEAAKFLNVSPAVLLFWLFVANRAASAISRAIPDTATGFVGFLRRFLAIVGTEVPTKIAPGVTVKDVARGALATPPIAANVEAAKAEGHDPVAVTVGASGPLTGGGNGQVTLPRD